MNNELGEMRVASDVGGTFTDIVVYRPSGNGNNGAILTTLKVDSTPPVFEQGVLHGIDEAGIDGSEVSFFAHGTTVVINALLSRQGSKCGLITTRGFRDVLDIGRCNRPDIFNFRFKKPQPFIPRYLRTELTERVNCQGEIEQAIQLDELVDILDMFKSEQVEAIAVCLLHSYINPTHEQAVLERIKTLWPEIPVLLSSQISREWREYERSTTTGLTAYVYPTANAYLERLHGGLKARQFDGQIYVMQSNGGVDTFNATKQRPITLVESGPASGVLGAAALGRLAGEENLIALDIGGTTAKCSLIDRGHVPITTEYRIEHNRMNPGYPLQVPVIDLVEIGSGGGSIAWLDEGEKLRVGPKSAGAHPGPAAYGQGGVEPTTTDANLITGRIDQNNFRGKKADMSAARKACQGLADILKVSVEEIARGIIRIANNDMVNALKLVSINRGYDPRDFALVAFGGGGPMHAAALACELGIKKVIIPPHSAVFSAWGMLMSDVRRDYVRTRLTEVSTEQLGLINSLFQDLQEQAAVSYAQEGIEAASIVFTRYADMRYKSQEHTIKVGLPLETLKASELVQLERSFHENYEREYSYQLDRQIEIVNFHLVAIAEVARPEPIRQVSKGKSLKEAIIGMREVDYDTQGTIRTNIYDRGRLEPDMLLKGPAIIEEASTTIVVWPEQEMTVDDIGNLHISI